MTLGAYLGHGAPDNSGHQRAAADSSIPALTWPTLGTRRIRAGRLHFTASPGRHPRGNPGHELGGARTPRSWPSARASRRATCPGRRGRQPPQAQGTAGPIDCGAHWGHSPTASMGQQRTAPASRRPGKWLLTTERRRSRDRPCRSLKATVRDSSPWRRRVPRSRRDVTLHA
jgi:hypothetical protein